MLSRVTGSLSPTLTQNERQGAHRPRRLRRCARRALAPSSPTCSCTARGRVCRSEAENAGPPEAGRADPLGPGAQHLPRSTRRAALPWLLKPGRANQQREADRGRLRTRRVCPASQSHPGQHDPSTLLSFKGKSIPLCQWWPAYEQGLECLGHVAIVVRNESAIRRQDLNGSQEAVYRVVQRWGTPPRLHCL
jgi:hypothetical protein